MPKREMILRYALKSKDGYYTDGKKSKIWRTTSRSMAAAMAVFAHHKTGMQYEIVNY